MDGDKSGSPPCGLYMRIDDYTKPEEVTKTIREIALVINRTSGYAQNKHVVEFAFDAGDQAQVKAVSDLVGVVQTQGLVAILSGHHEDVLSADGVIVETAADFDAADKALLNEDIIGFACGGSKEKAGEAILLEADYVILSADPALVAWWMKKKPAAHGTLCCVSGNLTPDNVAEFTALGVDFVDATNYILGHEKGIMQGTVNMLHALELAVQEPQVKN